MNPISPEYIEGYYAGRRDERAAWVRGTAAVLEAPISKERTKVIEHDERSEKEG